MEKSSWPMTLENRNAMQRVFRSTVEGLIVGSRETRQKVGFKKEVNLGVYRSPQEKQN